MVLWNRFILLFGGFIDTGIKSACSFRSCAQNLTVPAQYLSDLWAFNLDELKWKQIEGLDPERSPGLVTLMVTTHAADLLQCSKWFFVHTLPRRCHSPWRIPQRLCQRNKTERCPPGRYLDAEVCVSSLDWWLLRVPGWTQI